MLKKSELNCPDFDSISSLCLLIRVSTSSLQLYKSVCCSSSESYSKKTNSFGIFYFLQIDDPLSSLSVRTYCLPSRTSIKNRQYFPFALLTYPCILSFYDRSEKSSYSFRCGAASFYWNFIGSKLNMTAFCSSICCSGTGSIVSSFFSIA